MTPMQLVHPARVEVLKLLVRIKQLEKLGAITPATAFHLHTVLTRAHAEILDVPASLIEISRERGFIKLMADIDLVNAMPLPEVAA